MPNVRIRIERGQESGVDAQQAEKKTEAQNVATTSLFAHQMVGTAKQIINYQFSNIANFTGNYIEQEQVNKVLDMIGDMSTMVLGFVAGGPAGGAAAVVGVTTKTVLKIISDNRQDQLMERDRLYNLERSGNSTKNGSRGTEN